MHLNFIQHISIQVNDLGIDIQFSAVHVLIYPGGGLDELIRDSHTVPYLLISALSLSLSLPTSTTAFLIQSPPTLLRFIIGNFVKRKKLRCLEEIKFVEKNIIDRH